MNYSDMGKIGYSKTKEKLITYNLKKQSDAYSKYYKNPHYCAYCKMVIPYEKRRNKFCSHSCSAKKNNLGFAHNPKKIRECKGCGGDIDRVGCRYCSSCKEKGLNKRIIPFESLKQDQTRRKRLEKERGHRCEVCGNNSWMSKPIPLELDHKDGDSSNNDKDNNLRLICPNCHALSKNYKGKNIGKGRANRRERYRKGLSY